MEISAKQIDYATLCVFKRMVAILETYSRQTKLTWTYSTISQQLVSNLHVFTYSLITEFCHGFSLFQMFLLKVSMGVNKKQT